MRGDRINTIPEAIAALRARIMPVDAESVPAEASVGRVLAEDIVLDRPSPPCDVSAMDGYAIRMPIPPDGTLRVLADALPGRPAPALATDPDAAIRIFTGAPVPQGATTVVQRERFEEYADTVTLLHDAEVREGANIRRRGENGQPGEIVCRDGRPIGPVVLSAMASCGMTSVRARSPLRVGVLVTGDEVLAANERPEEWSLRDSNGPALQAMLSGRSWIGSVERLRAGDNPRTIAEAARALLDNNDALIITGGVSAGDHDHVPRVLADLGIKVVFHKLPIRPGKPVLGAVDPSGRPVLGLPGNPVSVMVTAALLALPALRVRAGMDELAPAGFVEVKGDACAPPSLTWYPLVRLQTDGTAALVAGRGSGDWIAAARSDGFVEVPAGHTARGVRCYIPWND
ncbi:MAG: molybdopterin molybdotransferase MoeA [Phycisphaeraceae bacterium]|nr:molybdopterin molybdotransferase MoeA [Phycisphaeraceae bacterium]